jgi:hypothetical protein
LHHVRKGNFGENIWTYRIIFQDFFFKKAGALWEEHKLKGGSNKRVLTGIFISDEEGEVTAGQRKFTQ